MLYQKKNGKKEHKLRIENCSPISKMLPILEIREVGRKFANKIVLSDLLIDIKYKYKQNKIK